MAGYKVGFMKLRQHLKNIGFHILAVLLILVSFNSYATASATTYPTGAWQVSSLEEQGMESQTLAEMMDYIRKYSFNIDSILVVRNGFKVFDVCFWPFSKGQKHNIYSCTKSIMSALIGIAIDKGYIQDVNQPTIDFFPDKVFSNSSDLKKSITLENLLMMTSGLKCRDSYLYRWKGLFEMRSSPDWAQYVLDLPMVEPPGEKFEYCNGVSYLLSVIIQNTTKMKTLDFAKKYLFEPLGIDEIAWANSPQGVDIGYGEMWLKAYDMAKFGWLYLNKGRWGNHQILPSAWVEQSTRGHIPATLFDHYGYQWWIDSAGYYMAVGYRGQRIFVIPEKNMVVVFTADLTGRESFIPKKLLDYYIIPAASSSNALPSNTQEKARLDALIASVSRAPLSGIVWISENEGTAKDGVFIRTASPAFAFKYPLGCKKTAIKHPGQTMKMKAPGDFEFSAFVGEIPEGVKIEDFGPKLYAHELENVGTDINVVLNKEITLKCGTQAYQTEIKWLFNSSMPIRTYLVIAYKDGKYICVDAHPFENSKRAERIVQSLILKKD
jgi:CubicO group peptidase (beta-lactamase class C family)